MRKGAPSSESFKSHGTLLAVGQFPAMTFTKRAVPKAESGVEGPKFAPSYRLALFAPTSFARRTGSRALRRAGLDLGQDARGIRLEAASLPRH